MKAMVLERAGSPLVLKVLPVPTPRAGQALVRVLACAVCRTDLHVVDGELTEPKLPLVPGHEIVGTVESVGEGCTRVKAGDRILFGKWSGTEVTLDGEELLIMKESDILGVIA